MEEREYSKTLYGWCIFGLAASLLLLIVTGVYTRFAEVEADLLKWFGRFHPVTLHTPIGLIPALIILEIYALRPRNHGVRAANMIVLALAVLTANIAACTGLLLGESGGYDEQIFERHKIVGLGMAMALLVGGFLRLRYYRTGVRGNIFVYWLLLLGSSGAMVVAGHDGGSLTHGKNFLHEYQPDWVPGGIEEEEGQEVAQVDAGGVIGIFQEKCFRCHAAEKQKGDYRMDTREFAFTPGETGLIPIVEGQPMKSYLVELVSLPLHDDLVMPPEGKPPLTNEEIVQIIHWVSAGAPWAEPVVAVKQDAPATNTQTSETDAAPPQTNDVQNVSAETTPPPAAPQFVNRVITGDRKILEKQADERLVLTELTDGRVELTLTGSGEYDLIAAITPFKDNLAKLNIAHAQLKAEDWKALGEFKTLTSLHAPYSNITNVELDTIATMTGLTYLNLHGTEVSDLGVKKLEPMKALKRIYLDVTEVTVDGADAIRSLLPECNVIFR